MSWPAGVYGVLALSLLLGGCATVDLKSGFLEVHDQVEQRTGAAVVWNGGTDLDKETSARIHALLRQKLTLEAAVQVALLNHRDLQAVYSDLGVAQADLVQAGLLNNPIFDAAVKFPTTGGGPPNLELSAVMSFLDLFYMPLRKRVAAARFEEAKFRVTVAVLDHAARVRSALYAHQANRQMLELRRTITQALGASLEVTRRLREAGNVTDLDFARERAQAEAARLVQRLAETAARQSRERLNDLMGLWGDLTDWQSEERLPEIPAAAPAVDGIERVAVERSVDLAMARQRIVVAGEQLGYNRITALIPELHLGPLGEREEGSWTLGPTVEFPLPLFDQGQARIARATADLRRAQQEYYALAVRIRATARLARDRLEASRDRALYYRDIMLPLYARILNEAQLHYNAMQLGPLQLLRARERQIETGAAFVESLRDHWLAQADLEQIMSGSLPRLNGFEAVAGRESMKPDEREGH